MRANGQQAEPLERMEASAKKQGSRATVADGSGMNGGKKSGRLGLGARKARWESNPDSGTLGL